MPLRRPARATAPSGVRAISEATVARLPVYHRLLADLAERGIGTVSSEGLAEAAGVTSAMLRKDLSHLGSYGTRGVGYDVRYLLYQIARELGITQDWPVVVVGVGNLGRALASYAGFATRGFRLAGLVDADPARAGERVGAPGHEVAVAPLADLERVVRAARASIGVIATPASAAQGVCDRLVAAGLRSILNFAPVVLSVPAGVELREVDLAVELQILAFHEQRRAADHPAPARPGAAVGAGVAPAVGWAPA